MTNPVPQPPAIYSAVVAQRLQWDNLLWQAPVLSLTAQAFLFSISLGHDSSRTARIITALLAMVTAGLSIQLMARYRRLDLFAARWLEDWERNNGVLSPIHGRNSLKNYVPTHPNTTAIPAKGWLIWLGERPSFTVWTYGLGLFGFAALVVLVLALVHPAALS